MVDHEPGRRSQAGRPKPGAVAVTRHHQQVSALGGRNDQPVGQAAAKLRPRLASKPLLRSGHQVGRGLLR